MIRWKGLVCLATRRLDDAMPTIVQHLMQALAEEISVLYIEPPMDPLFILRRRRWPIHSGGRAPQRLERRVPLVLPFEKRLSLLRPLNRRLHRLQVQSWIRRRCRPEDPLWVPNPNFAGLAEALKRPICYYVSDDYARAPAVVARASAEAVACRDARLVDKARWVLVNSPALLDSYRRRHDRVFWIPNGVDVAHYQKAFSGQEVVPAELKAIRRPVVGFLGAVDDFKVDFELLESAARSLKDVSFVTVGPLGWGTGGKRPPRASNLHHLGIRRYQDLPAYLAGFDVAMLPNRTRGYMEANFPMKLFEYFAAGLPVVATALPSLAPFTPWVQIAEDGGQFVEALRRELRRPDEGRRREALQIAEANTWARQAKRVLAVLGGGEPEPVIPSSRRGSRP